MHEPTRRSYDTLAEAYEHRLADELTYKPLDRALLTTLVEQCPPGLPLADLGCGPGHVAGWLATQGAPVVGIDLSPGMVAVAAARHPDAQFRVGDLLSLPASDGEFGSAVCFYSIIHLESHELEACFAEVRRVLVPGGRLLLAFHVGDEVRHFDELWDQKVDLDFRLLDTDTVVGLLGGGGIVIEAQLERHNYPREVETRRAYVLARRPG